MKASVNRFDSGMHYIEVPSKIADTFLIKGQKRIVCVIDKTHELHCAIMKVKEGFFYVILGTRILKELKIKHKQLISVTFKEDKSELQFSMPEEFQEVLETDDEARKKFDKLTAGNKRGLISLVLQVKAVDKRIERSLKIAERLKHGITSPQKILLKSSIH